MHKSTRSHVGDAEKAKCTLVTGNVWQALGCETLCTLRPSAAASGYRYEKQVRAQENEIDGERKWKNPLVRPPMHNRSSCFVLIFAFCWR
jgi:hypothetical protein